MEDDDKDDLESWKKSNATKSATFVASLQQQLPLVITLYRLVWGAWQQNTCNKVWIWANIQGRIVYLSATGASDPKHFCNLSRLGLWGPGTSFKDQFDFIAGMLAPFMLSGRFAVPRVCFVLTFNTKRLPLTSCVLCVHRHAQGWYWCHGTG